MKKIAILAILIQAAALLAVRAEEAPAAPAPPPKLSVDQLFDQLLQLKPEEMKAKFDALKADATKMNEEAKGLRAKADELDKKAEELVKRVGVLEQLIAQMPGAPAAKPEEKKAADAAKPAEKKMAAAAAAPAKPEEKKMAAPPAKPEEKKMAAAPAKPEEKKMAAPAAAPPAEMAAKKDDGPKITYVDNVAPIFMAKCASCHNQDKAKGGLTIDDFDKLMTGGGTGVVIVPGNADGSRLYRLVTHQEEPKMPMGGSKLDDASLDLIKKWIDGGALKDKNSKAKMAAAKPAEAMAAPAPAVVVAGEIPMPKKDDKIELATLAGPLAIRSMAASPVAPLLAVSGYRQILFYNADTLEPLKALPFPEGVAESIRFSRNGSLMVAAGGEAGKIGVAAVYDVVSGERVGEYGKTFDTILSADISLDHTQVAVGLTNKKARVYNTATGEMMYEITKHTDWVQAVTFSPDGWYLATGDRAGGLYVWIAENGRDVHNLRGHNGAINSLDFRADSNMLASGSGDGHVMLWEMENGGKVKDFVAHGTGVLAVRFAADARLVTSGVDRTTKLWKPDGAGIATLPAMDDWAYCATFASQDSRVIAGSWKGEVKVWEVASAKDLGGFKLAP